MIHPQPTRQQPLVATAAEGLEIAHVSAHYGGFEAIRDVSLTIAPRTITALIGGSGCGKSTLLRTINRMHETCDQASVTGSIRLDGTDLYGPDIDPVAVRRVIGMVFQRANPFPTMSVRDNVLVGLRLRNRRLSRDHAQDVVEMSLRAANLWDDVKDRLNRPGASLSGGQQQRLCIARVIAVEPKVILMDEPCSALDPISTAAIEDLMINLRRDYTVVIVTHNMQQAARVADKTAFLSVSSPGGPGTVVEYADTDTIFHHPTQSATADYVGGRFG
ncbi:MAG: ATP-binding cassette domain-containing protein [Propionibacteriaceae bacterium]|jgi:phosphate transport system ATP-binding protein|nr:ATP-binding cassette domain-containing protein [Propionibacteriaceae bacterium]